MREDIEFDGVLDPAEEAALQELLRAPELRAEEWTGLEARVRAAAEWPLSQRRRAQGARRRATRWIASAVPLAAAAALLLFLQQGGEPAPSWTTPAEQALVADVSDDEFIRLVSGSADAEALLLLAVDEE